MARESIGARLRYETLRRCNFACYYCGTPAALGVDQLHIDHVVPVALGGTNDPWNLIASCQGCNLGKGPTMPPQEVIDGARQLWEAWSIDTGALVAICQRCDRPWTLFVDEEPNSECWPCTHAWTDGLMVGKGNSQ